MMQLKDDDEMEQEKHDGDKMEQEKHDADEMTRVS